MDQEPSSAEVAALEDELAQQFEHNGVDYVPDPMVLRAAELFVLGRSGCREQLHGYSDEQAWSVIDKNLDGLLAFFHVLMTRERVPFIDYKWTFPGGTLMGELGEIATDIHPPQRLYEILAKDGAEKVASMKLSAVAPEIVADVAAELGTAGYEWYPEEARFEHLRTEQDGAGRQTLATFALGGIIFGGYAQVTRSDHLLQTKRARVFAELTVPHDEAVLWGFSQEQRLYERLEAMVEQTDHLNHADFTLPPSVVPLIVATEQPREPKALLEHALRLRASDTGEAYREWHARLRTAWAQGRRDLDAEAAVDEVAKEIERRFGLGQGALGGPNVRLSGGVGVHLGVVQLGAEVEHEIPVGVPDRVRNWLVERLRFRGHRKMLLRMGLEQATFDNLALGLKNMWWAAPQSRS